MDKIKLNRAGDYTELTRDQIEALFNCGAPEVKLFDAGCTLSLAENEKLDRGAYELNINNLFGGNTKIVTLSDDQIERLIEIEQEPVEDEPENSYVW